MTKLLAGSVGATIFTLGAVAEARGSSPQIDARGLRERDVARRVTGAEPLPLELQPICERTKSAGAAKMKSAILMNFPDFSQHRRA